MNDIPKSWLIAGAALALLWLYTRPASAAGGKAPRQPAATPTGAPVDLVNWEMPSDPNNPLLRRINGDDPWAV